MLIHKSEMNRMNAVLLMLTKESNLGGGTYEKHNSAIFINICM